MANLKKMVSKLRSDKQKLINKKLSTTSRSEHLLSGLYIVIISLKKPFFRSSLYRPEFLFYYFFYFSVNVNIRTFYFS